MASWETIISDTDLSISTAMQKADYPERLQKVDSAEPLHKAGWPADRGREPLLGGCRESNRMPIIGPCTRVTPPLNTARISSSEQKPPQPNVKGPKKTREAKRQRTDAHIKEMARIIRKSGEYSTTSCWS